MTVLDDIIDASTDSSVAVVDLLRKVQVAASRLSATEVVDWVKLELAGYGEGVPLPSYRNLHTNVVGTFAGPMQSFRRLTLTARPSSMDSMWDVEVRQPLMEIQALSESDNDASREWPAIAVEEFRASGMLRLEFHNLYTVQNIITPQSLRGLIDVIRSKALEFALDLQSADPQAGSVGGPTITSEPQLASAIFNVTNNIYGDGANVATGSGNRQRSKVAKGDSAALRREVEALGLTAEDAEQFAQLISDERSVDKPQVKRFLAKVRAGSIAVAAGVGTDMVAGSLVELGKAFLGL